MATRDDKQLGVILLIIIVSFAIYWAVKLFSLLFAGNENIIVDSVAAFAGAFFAFLFLRMAEFFGRYSKRLVEHYNALVALETQVNDAIGIIQDNITNIDGIIPVIASGNVTWNQINKIPADKSNLIKLYNGNLGNKLHELFYDIRRINDDAETFNRGYTILRDALIQENLERPQYTVNAELMVKQLIPFQVLLKKTQEKGLQIMAEIRVLISRDKPLASHLLHVMILGTLHTPTRDEIGFEMHKLRQELADSAQKSREEKDTALREAGLLKDGG